MSTRAPGEDVDMSGRTPWDEIKARAAPEREDVEALLRILEEPCDHKRATCEEVGCNGPMDRRIAATLRDLSRKLEEVVAKYEDAGHHINIQVERAEAAEAALEEARRERDEAQAEIESVSRIADGSIDRLQDRLNAAEAALRAWADPAKAAHKKGEEIPEHGGSNEGASDVDGDVQRGGAAGYRESLRRRGRGAGEPRDDQDAHAGSRGDGDRGAGGSEPDGEAIPRVRDVGALSPQTEEPATEGEEGRDFDSEVEYTGASGGRDYAAYHPDHPGIFGIGGLKHEALADLKAKLATEPPTPERTP